MIDLHSHILPELDDGARDLRQALEMARMALDSGVTAMVATPHCSDDRVEEVQSSFFLLSQALAETNTPLQLLPGMEIFGTADTASMLLSGRLLTLNDSQYPLIEFRFHSDGQEETRILNSVLQAGYRPIVAHPERYRYIQQNPGLLNTWVRMGCLLQLNKGSLLGRFGSTARQLSLALVDRGFAAVVASDAHGTASRTPWMAEADQLLADLFSPAAAQVLLRENPRRIIENESIPPAQPGWF